MNFFRIFSINLLIFIFGIFFIEASFRTYSFFTTCISGRCNGIYFRNIKTFNVDENYFAKLIGIFRFHEVLGYVPMENFSKNISAYGWNNSFVSISKDGFRNTSSKKPSNKVTALALGDSFTFGDQVSDSDTWVACLEKGLGIPIDNAGVSGYGAGQSILRGQEKLLFKNYDYVFFSILVGSDLERDQLVYRYGLAKPALVNENDSVKWTLPPSPNIPGTVNNPIKPNSSFIYLFERSVALQSALKNRIEMFNLFGDKLTIKAKNAASLTEILEWTIKNFQNFSSKNRIIILHYPNDFKSEHIHRERSEILKIASSNSLKVIDTYSALLTKNSDQIWDGHYTVFGNNLICNHILNFVIHNE